MVDRSKANFKIDEKSFLYRRKTVAFIAWTKCLTFFVLNEESKRRNFFVAFSGKFSAQNNDCGFKTEIKKYLDFATSFVLFRSWMNWIA